MITSVSVRVLRSYDYCHFEVCLGGTPDPLTISSEVFADDLRKTAARLTDKAVEQYKIAKREAERNPTTSKARLVSILAKGESERTPEEKAIVKAIADARFNESRYDYQDDYCDGNDND